MATHTSTPTARQPRIRPASASAGAGADVHGVADDVAVRVRPSRFQVIEPLLQATVKALVTLPGGNVLGWPRSAGDGVNPLRDPTGAITVDVDELLNPNTAVKL